MSENIEIKGAEFTTPPPEVPVIEEEHSSASGDSSTTPKNSIDRSEQDSKNSFATDIDEKEAIVPEKAHYRDDLFFRLEQKQS